MKKQETRKEILTLKNIRSDLRRKLWASWLLLVFSVAFIVWFIYEFHQYPELLFAQYMGRRGRGLPGWVLLLSLPFFLYVVIKEAWLVSCGFRRKLYITKDTLISSEVDSHYSRHSWRTAWCTLHFNCYGDYAVPEKNYPWSEQYAMSAQGVDNMAFEGGEYYLVLSKPHSGKILLAYNAELFLLEGEDATDA